MKIAIVVGHKQAKQGAKAADGVSEYVFNSRLAPMVAARLIALGHEPLVVCRDGISYGQLPARINKTGAALCLSLHCNAFNTRATGSEVLHYKGSANSARLAAAIQSEVVAALQLADRGLRPVRARHKGVKGDKGGYLCKATAMPCVIVEAFFIDNPSDYAAALANLDGLAGAIAGGVMNYEETSWKS